MADVDRDQHWPWLGFALEEALRLGLTRPDDVIHYATPEVMAAQLPHDLTATVLAKALASGKLDAAAILETATAAQLAEHLEPEILWRCLDDIAALAELATEGGQPRGEARRGRARVLGRALESRLVEPADVVRFLPPAQFVKDAPLAVVAELIRAGLTRGVFNPEIVLTHLTPEVIAENLATHLVWSCISDAAMRRFELGAAAPSAPAPATATATAKATSANGHANANGNGNGAVKAASATASSGPVKAATSLLGGATKPSPTKGTSSTAIPAVKASAASAAPPAPAAWEDDAIDTVEEAPLPPAPPTPAAIRADRR
jgi:hypothetical protein